MTHEHVARARLQSSELPVPSRRLPGLDLLRTAAILLVALHHSWGNAVPTVLRPLQQIGWMGVDLFFVLSGYLIGSQLLRPYKNGQRPSLPDFYIRRAFRILPAFLVVLIAYYSVPSLREDPKMMPLWRFLTFTMNLGFDRAKGAAFSHAWSLCVEEYFYLLFPLLCMTLMYYRASLKWTVGVFCFFVVAGIIGRLVSWIFLVAPSIRLQGLDAALWIVFPEYIYYPTYTRLDGLLAGVALASIRLFRPGWWASAMHRGHSLALAGCVLTAWSIWLCIDRASFAASVFGFPLLSIGFGLLLASSLSANGLLARVRIPGVGLIATLSYSIYLTHKAVMHLDREFIANWLPLEGSVGLFVYAVTSVAVAYALHVCIERPCLTMRERLLAIRPDVVMPQVAAHRSDFRA